MFYIITQDHEYPVDETARATLAEAQALVAKWHPHIVNAELDVEYSTGDCESLVIVKA